MHFFVSNFWSAPRVSRRPGRGQVRHARFGELRKHPVPELSALPPVYDRGDFSGSGYVAVNDPRPRERRA